MGYIVLFIFKDMDKINAVITGVGGYVPEDVLTNEDISKLVDTTDEWIMTRVGIKERRILKGTRKDKCEPGRDRSDPHSNNYA